MADTFRTLGSVATIEVDAAGSGREVQQVSVQAQPSGVTFPVRVDLAGFSLAAVEAVAAPLAAALNDLADDPGVGVVSVAQEVNAAGNLEDRASITVQSEDGRFSTLVTAPLGDVLRGGIGAKIADAKAQMEALAQL